MSFGTAAAHIQATGCLQPKLLHQSALTSHEHVCVDMNSGLQLSVRNLPFVHKAEHINVSPPLFLTTGFYLKLILILNIFTAKNLCLKAFQKKRKLPADPRDLIVGQNRLYNYAWKGGRGNADVERYSNEGHRPWIAPNAAGKKISSLKREISARRNRFLSTTGDYP